MKYILLISLSLILRLSNAQDIQGTVNDNSNNPIPYASIYYTKAEVGTYTDAHGNFSLPKRIGDTLTISVIGFEKQSFLIEKNSTTINVKLKPQIINLNEVVITTKKKSTKKKAKTYQLGNSSKKFNFVNSGYKGRTIAYLVKTDPNITGQIKSIQYSINPINQPQITDATVRPHLYTIDPNTGKPGKELLINNEVVKVKKEETKLTIDISHMEIELPPDGLYIAMEWLSNSPWYSLTKSTKPMTVYTKFMGKDWQLRPPQKESTSRTYYEVPNFSIVVWD